MEGLSVEFCECGSLKVNGSCTNKKCKNYVRKDPPATAKQLEIIRDLLFQLGRDEDEYNLNDISSKEAASLIEDLEAEIETNE